LMQVKIPYETVAGHVPHYGPEILQDALAVAKHEGYDLVFDEATFGEWNAKWFAKLPDRTASGSSARPCEGCGRPAPPPTTPQGQLTAIRDMLGGL